jgi:LacI family transcriptional regulator
MRDVAARAGVSRPTVSRVLNNHATVDPALRERVLAAVQELGYRRNSLARGLRRQMNTVLAVVIPDIENPFFTTIARAVEDTAVESDFLVVVCNSDEDHEKEAEYLQLLLDQQIAGLIIAPADEERSDVSSLVAGNIPITAIDRRLRHQPVDTVILDNIAGGEQATAALIQAGHRNVATITGPTHTTTGAERLSGYRKALRAAGVRYKKRLVVDGGYRIEGGKQAALKLLRQPNPPDAIFVANNLMTLGALEALAELSMTPADVPLVSFDDLPWGADRNHTVSTIGQPVYDMGRAAATMVLERVHGFKGPAREVQLPLELAEERLRRRLADIGLARFTRTALNGSPVVLRDKR